MFYNLTDILSSEDKVIEIEVPFEQDTVSNGYETYAVLEKSDKISSNISGLIKSSKKGQLIRFYCVNSF